MNEEGWVYFGEQIVVRTCPNCNITYDANTIHFCPQPYNITEQVREIANDYVSSTGRRLTEALNDLADSQIQSTHANLEYAHEVRTGFKLRCTNCQQKKEHIHYPLCADCQAKVNLCYE